jgi:hypothetical protein
MFRVDEAVLLGTKYGCRWNWPVTEQFLIRWPGFAIWSTIAGETNRGKLPKTTKVPPYSKPFQRPLPPLHTIGKHHVNP